MAFASGLLHGFGFAGALHEIGMPQTDIPLALLFFDVGVEVRQMIFIPALLAAIALAPRIPIAPPAWAWRVPPYAIGAVVIGTLTIVVLMMPGQTTSAEIGMSG